MQISLMNWACELGVCVRHLCPLRFSLCESAYSLKRVPGAPFCTPNKQSHIYQAQFSLPHWGLIEPCLAQWLMGRPALSLSLSCVNKIVHRIRAHGSVRCTSQCCCSSHNQTQPATTNSTPPLVPASLRLLGAVGPRHQNNIKKAL